MKRTLNNARFFGLVVTFCGLGYWTVTVAEAQEAQDGATAGASTGTVAVCTVCHGENGEGNAELGAPRIGGMESWYISRQLSYFRKGIRAGSDADIHGTQMRAIAMMLDGDQAIEDLSAHFAALTPAPAAKTISGDAEHGKQLFTICSACHMPDGSGNEALNTPSLVGQHDWYIVRQIENYRNGIRGGNPNDQYGAQMVPMVKTLMSHQDVLDVAAFIDTLRK